MSLYSVQQLNIILLHTRVTEIDKNQRATLTPLNDGAVPLKTKVPYDQLRPYMTSELHDFAQQETHVPSRCHNTPPHAPISNIDVHNDTIINTNTNKVDTTTNKVDTTINTVNTTANTVDSTANTVDTVSNKIKANSNKVDTTTNKVKSKNTVGKNKRNILHCAANANPEKLVSTILKKNYWLTDEHMDHGQWLISKQFPKMKGFHSVLAFEGKTPKVEKGLKDFVQIVNIGGNHWVTVTNIRCEENRIKVYDTLYRSMSNTDKFKLAALLNTSLESMVIEWPSVQIQEGDSDCGLFAMAIALALCNGQDPCQQSYDQNVMRVHLASCFQCEEIATFPVSKVKCKRSKSIEETEVLFCHCRMPYKEGVFMIECSNCLQWFHRSCDKVPRIVGEQTHFHCMNCK